MSPDRRRHRGPHPEDHARFAPSALPRLRAAVAELSWLLSRGYPSAAALALVGNRHQLDQRQRLAVRRCACADGALQARRRARHELPAIAGREVAIDGFNVLTTVEAALAGGAVLVGRDGCCRDMASMHGSYRKVEETRLAAHRLGILLASHAPAACRWLLDRPVGNSGRLRALLLDEAAAAGWPWSVDLVDDPDRALRATDAIVATADSAVLDGARAWIDLARAAVEGVAEAWIVDLREGGG